MKGRPAYPVNTMFVGCTGRLFWVGGKEGAEILFEVLGEGLRQIHTF
jgi:hypothetical protein